MKKNLKSLFSEDVQKILSDDTLTAIEEAIENKVKLAEDAALRAQDEVYAEKLKALVEAIDKDHTKKMKRILEKDDKAKSAKLLSLVKKYERSQGQDLKKFKKTIVESVGAFLDEFINESISKDDLSQAVKNKSAYNVLENLRKVLAVDSTLMKEFVTSAILDGKQEYDTLKESHIKLQKQFKVLKEQKEEADKKVFLESKCAKFPQTKKNFITKALGDKSLKFIEENFDYSIRLFDKQEKKQLQNLKEDAIKERPNKPDFVKEEKILTEKLNKEDDAINPYLQEMDKMRF
jgi:phage terminase small subunit